MSTRHDVCQPYMDYTQEILDNGLLTDDRTGTGTRSLFGGCLKFDVATKAPFLTQRKLPLRSVIGELLWFIEGSVNTDVLKQDYKCNFWDEWSSPKTRTIGPMYGKQWRNAHGVDQLANLLKSAVETPTSRRLIVNTWAPEFIPNDNTDPTLNPESDTMALAPCHFAYQLKLYQISYADPAYLVHLSYAQRSLDFFLGAPNNIASYYILLRLICGYLERVTGHRHLPCYLIVHMGDTHIYNNHIDAVNELLSRDESPEVPRFTIDDEAIDIFASYIDGSFYKEVDLPTARSRNLHALYSKIEDYHPQAAIKGARNV